jgi:type IV pilus assembly protein PilE
MARRPGQAQAQRTRGFSLTELLVAMVIASVLAAIAMPLYQQWMQQTRRTDAYNMLVEAANREARFFADNEIYTATLTTLGYAADPATSPEGFYQLTAALNANGYTLTATPIGVQASDTECGTLTYDSLGSKGASGAGDCWR